MSTLREAARALLDAMQRDSLDISFTTEAAVLLLEESLAAPEPGPDELQRKLEELWRDGYDFAFDLSPVSAPERNRLIAEILELWPRRDVLIARCLAAYQMLGGMGLGGAQPEEADLIRMLDALSQASDDTEPSPEFKAEIDRLLPIRWGQQRNEDDLK